MVKNSTEKMGIFYEKGTFYEILNKKEKKTQYLFDKTLI